MYPIAKKAIRLPLEIWLTTQSAMAGDESRRWLKLALFSLMLSGLFSFVIVMARAPVVSEWITDPLFARKSLVLHVNFSLVVWFYAFLAVLAIYLIRPVRDRVMRHSVQAAILGVGLMAASLFLPGADPVLVNYVPVLNHPVFLIGLIVFGLGISTLLVSCMHAGPVINRRSRPGFHSNNGEYAIRLAAALVPIAFVTFLIAWFLTPGEATTEVYYERIMWGGGHILQFANVLGMMAVWLICIRKLTGSELWSADVNKVLILILALPAAVSPLLMSEGTMSQFYYGGFTTLMRWFIFPIVSIYIVAVGIAFWRAWREGRIGGDRYRKVLFYGLLTSVLLTVAGFVIGAMIRSSSTLIPAHYHASLGGVTVAYMVMIFLLMHHYGYRFDGRRSRRLLPLQPLFFGGGQLLFVIGFAWAGMQGMGRKLFGSDQAIHTVDAWIGLAAMTAGGLMAMAGGLLFIWLVVDAYRAGKKPDAERFETDKYTTHNRRGSI